MRLAALVTLVLTFANGAHAQQVQPIAQYQIQSNPSAVPMQSSPGLACQVGFGILVQSTPWHTGDLSCELRWVPAGYVATSDPNVFQCLDNVQYVATLQAGATWCTSYGSSWPFYHYNWDSAVRGFFCPGGSPAVPASGTQPAHCGGVPKPKPCPDCEKPVKAGDVHDPINALSGEKTQMEVDYQGVGPFPLKLSRVYDSFGLQPGAQMGLQFYSLMSTDNPAEMQPVPFTPSDPLFNTMTDPTGGTTTPTHVAFDNHKWRLNYDRSLTVTSGDGLRAMLYRPNNTTRGFNYTNGAWVPYAGEFTTALSYTTDGSGNITGFKYVDEADETEIYDLTGTLQSITNRAGLVQTMHYTQNPNNDPTVLTSAAPFLLTSVSDSFGRVLSFSYDSSNRCIGATDPNGGSYTYSYDALGNLAGVTYPDGHARRYQYANTTFTAALTGIVDENGNQYVSWTYDGYGDAITSQFAGGVERVAVSFASQTSSSVTFANGMVRTYGMQLLNDYLQPTTVTETCGTNCTRTSSQSYDANGNPASETDFNGNVTTHSYDLTRDLETSRTEASGTAQARTITTQWHPQYHLPTQIGEPGRITTFNYDSNGNLLTKTVTANGSSRTWTYTYNANGQVLTVVGPRTDVTDLTTYAYDGYGNLISITNAAGQTTTFANYDNNGRVGLITDPNGATTTLSYAPRGWLTGKVVSAGGIVQTTGYRYDYVGQLTQVTLPDNTTISYTYDPAHRLANIRDSLGNSINYTLDLMSNRIGETVTDPSGALTRQVNRVYDGLNRVQQVIGAAQ